MVESVPKIQPLNLLSDVARICDTDRRTVAGIVQARKLEWVPMGHGKAITPESVRVVLEALGRPWPEDAETPKPSSV